MKSGRGPICHMMGTKVCTSVDRTSRPASCGGNERVNVRNNRSNTPVLCNQRILKSQNDSSEIPF
jgi:hypothetical protein